MLPFRGPRLFSHAAAIGILREWVATEDALSFVRGRTRGAAFLAEHVHRCPQCWTQLDELVSEDETARADPSSLPAP